MRDRTVAALARRTLIVLAFLVVTGSAAFGELSFTHFTPDGGTVRLPSASVQKVLQDRAGHIWLGFFSSGLSRYNGHSMETFGVEDGLANLTVREIVQDRTGRLWVGTSANLVVSELPVDATAGGRVRFISRVGTVTLPTRLQIRTGTVVADADGWVSVAMPGEIRQYRFAPDGKLSERSIKLAANSAFLAVGRNGSLFAAFEDGGLAEVPRGSTTAELHYDQAYGTQSPTAVAVSRSGDLLIGMRSGEVWRRPSGSGIFEQIPIKASERISSFGESADGTIWASTLGAGVYAFRLQGPAEVRRLTRVDGFLGDSVWSVLGDREGNLWFGQNGGLSRLRYDHHAYENLTAISHTGEKPVLIDPSCFGVLPPLTSPASASDPTSWLWIVTGGGVTIVGPESRTHEIGVKDGLLSNSDYGIHRDERGTIWIATAGGLNAVVFDLAGEWPGVTERKAIRIFDREATLLQFALQQVTYMPHTIRTTAGESLFCAGSRVGLSCLVDDTWILMGQDSGLTYVYDFELDAENYLWVARYDAGVFRSREPITLEALRRIATSEDSRITDSGVETRSRMFDHVEGGGEGARSITIWNGAVWGGLSEGLARFRNGKRDLLLDKEQLGGDLVNAVLPDTQGGLWVAHSRGLTELDQNLAVVRRLTSGAGLISEESWSPMALAMGTDGRLYFATPKGVSMIRPKDVGRNDAPPRVVIEQFALKEEGRGRNELAISYAALSFVNEQNIRYRTRITGYDPEFSSPGTSTSLRYTNLPAWLVPKRYVFEVMASNGDGAWSRPEQRAFLIHPAWWQTWWALGLLALGVVVLILFVRRSRNHPIPSK